MFLTCPATNECLHDGPLRTALQGHSTHVLATPSVSGHDKGRRTREEEHCQINLKHCLGPTTQTILGVLELILPPINCITHINIIYMWCKYNYIVLIYIICLYILF